MQKHHHGLTKTCVHILRIQINTSKGLLLPHECYSCPNFASTRESWRFRSSWQEVDERFWWEPRVATQSHIEWQLDLPTFDLNFSKFTHATFTSFDHKWSMILTLRNAPVQFCSTYLIFAPGGWFVVYRWSVVRSSAIFDHSLIGATNAW